jgi:hypothetical protein
MPQPTEPRLAVQEHPDRTFSIDWEDGYGRSGSHLFISRDNLVHSIWEATAEIRKATREPIDCVLPDSVHGILEADYMDRPIDHRKTPENQPEWLRQIKARQGASQAAGKDVSTAPEGQGDLAERDGQDETAEHHVHSEPPSKRSPRPGRDREG